MTQEEINQFSELYFVFNERCTHLAEILVDYKVYSEPWSKNIAQAEHFEVVGDQILWYGYDEDRDYCSGYFPSKYLTMSDEEVREDCRKVNDEYLEKLDRRKKECQEAAKKADYELYLELKKRFENEK
jgi:hypothetical protein